MQNIYLGMDILLRKLLIHLQTQVSQSVSERIATVLIYMNKMVVNLGGSQNEIDLQLSQTDLAGWFGTSRGYVNQTLANMQRAGLLRLEGQKIILMDVSSLQKMAEDWVLKSKQQIA